MSIHLPLEKRKKPSPSLNVAPYYRIETSGVWAVPIARVTEVIDRALHKERLCSCFGKGEVGVRWFEGDDLDLSVLVNGDERGIRSFTRQTLVMQREYQRGYARMTGRYGPRWSVHVAARWPGLYEVATQLLLDGLDRLDPAISGGKDRIAAQFTVRGPSADVAVVRGVEVFTTILGPAARVYKAEAITYKDLGREMGAS